MLTGSSTSTITGKTIDLANNTLVATSAQLKAALTDETGSGSAVFAVSPVLATPTVDSLNGGQLSGMREKIINGRMEIDQRNSGAAVTITNTGAIYTVDRFWATRSAAISNYTVQRGSAPASLGFANYLLLTMGTGVTLGATDYASLGQSVEGLNISDLSWGSASARPVTLSFCPSGCGLPWPEPTVRHCVTAQSTEAILSLTQSIPPIHSSTKPSLCRVTPRVPGQSITRLVLT